MYSTQVFKTKASGGSTWSLPVAVLSARPVGIILLLRAQKSSFEVWLHYFYVMQIDKASKLGN